MKIKSYQVGGIVYTPFSPQQSQQTTTSSGTTSEKISGTMKKEIIDILKENGIPSDVDAFLNKANEFLNGSMSLSGKSLFGGTDDDYDLSDLITIQKMANDVRWNKGLYDNAIQNLDSENAWGEVALDSRGYMYVADEDGNISTVDPTKYDRTKQIALTNEQMLGYRERVGSFAMNSGILNSMAGTIGIKTVQDYLIGLVEKLGTSNLQGYASKEQNQIVNGIRHLMEAGPDGYYKITDKQQARDANSALHYLYNQLSAPMKRTLEATIAAEGGDPTKDKYGFLSMILTQNVDNEFKADFDQSATKHELEQTGQDKSSSGKTIELNDAIRLGTGQDLGVPQRFQIVSREGGAVFSVFGQNAGKVKDDKGNPLTSTNLEQMLNKAEAIKGLALTDSISFGDQLLHETDYSKIMFNSNRNMYRVEMPYKEVERGKFVPNFELHAKLNRVQNLLKGQPKLRQNILSVLKAEGISESDVYIDAEGKLSARNTIPFLVLGGIAGSGTLNFNEDSPYINRLSKQEGRLYKNEYNNIILSGDPYSDKDITGNSTTWSGSNIYEGNIFIAIDPSIAAHVGGTTKAPERAVMNVTQQNMQNTGMITNF